MSSGCARRSRRIRSTQRSSSRCAAWGTRPDLVDTGMEPSAVTPDAAGPARPTGTPSTSSPAPAAPSGVPGADASASALPSGPNGQASAPARSHREYRREGWEMAMRRNRVVRWFVSWLPHRVTIILRTALRWEHLAIAKVGRRWRRSLQLRVIGTTLVISTMMIAVLGFFLTYQIADGLLANAENAARAQAGTGLNQARSLPDLNVAPANNSAAEHFMLTVGSALQQQTGVGDTNYYVMVGLRSDYQTGRTFNPGVSPTVSSSSLPPALVKAVEKEQLATSAAGGVNRFYYTPTTLTFTTSGQPNVPALAVGTPLGKYYELYFIFPLEAEQQSLHIVQTTLIGAGLALIALLAAIASLVTRWVVVPVRHAAQAAQRLRAGHLGERMTVGGADDLGALATSFNEMAATLQGQLRELEE